MILPFLVAFAVLYVSTTLGGLVLYWCQEHPRFKYGIQVVGGGQCWYATALEREGIMRVAAWQVSDRKGIPYLEVWGAMVLLRKSWFRKIRKETK